MPLVPPSQRKGYTVEEVEEHCTPKSLWVIINRKVYDITAFHKRHPGGESVLLQLAGKDATAASAAAHKSALPGNLMWEFCVGSVVRFKAKPDVEKPPPPVVPPPAEKAAAKQSIIQRAAVMVPGPLNQPLTRRLSAKRKPKPTFQKEIAEKEAEKRPGSPRKGAADDSLKGATGLVMEVLQGEARLARWFSPADEPALEQQLRGLLASRLDASEWRPLSNAERGALGAPVGELAEALVGTFHCLPLGENALMAGLRALSAEPGNDGHLAKFVRRLRALIGSSCQDLRGEELKMLNGTWRNSAGLACTVFDGRCSFTTGEAFSLILKDGVITLNGWSATTVLTRTVQWQKAGKRMEWQRLETTEFIPAGHASA